MDEVIHKYRKDYEVGFAHSISADCHMSAGVAVVFRAHFGRPTAQQRVSKHLAVQYQNKGATVFSLVTKERYFGKPTVRDYDAAFDQLTLNFKRQGLKHLVCSPVGCVRDKIKPHHLIRNLKRFQLVTGAKVTIVSYRQDSYRELRNGVTHGDFLEHLQNLIKGYKDTSPGWRDVDSRQATSLHSSVRSDTQETASVSRESARQEEALNSPVSPHLNFPSTSGQCPFNLGMSDFPPLPVPTTTLIPASPNKLQQPLTPPPFPQQQFPPGVLHLNPQQTSTPVHPNNHQQSSTSTCPADPRLSPSPGALLTSSSSMCLPDCAVGGALSEVSVNKCSEESNEVFLG